TTYLARTAETFGGPTLLVWCECDDAVAEERINQRSAAGTDASDATVAVRRKQAANCEPPTEAEFDAFPHASLLRVNTLGPLEESVQQVIAALRKQANAEPRVAASGGVQ
ncbi:MAG: AAA family ATPase, partial [Planctomycetota bacterium]